MPTIEDAAREFLSCERIAVAGVSRDRRQAANAIYRKLKSAGRTVFPTNPTAERVEGDPCFPDLRSIPDGVEAVVIATPRDAALQVVRECLALGVRRVWMHRSLGEGSVSDDAVRLCRESGITVIAGACPMMYIPPVDFGHKCLRTVLGWMRRLPPAP